MADEFDDVVVDLTLLENYGLSLTALGTDTVPSLALLRNEYETRNAALIASKDKSESTDAELKKFLTDTVNQDESVVSAVESFKSAVRELLYHAVDADPRTVLPLIDAATEIRQDAMNERDYWIQKVKRISPATGEKVVDENFEDERREIGILGKVIRTAYGAVKSMVPTGKQEGKEDTYGPAEFPLKSSKTEGFLPDLSNLVRSQASDNPTGREALNRHIEFVWNGETLAAEILPSDVAHDYVSNLREGFVISWSGILAKLKETDQSLSSPEYWTLEFPTGTLQGRDKRDPKPTRKG